MVFSLLVCFGVIISQLLGWWTVCLVIDILCIQVRAIERIECMRSIPAWKYLIGIFAVFWVVLAIMLFIADIPFYVITWSLSIILILSAAIVALAWAWTHDY